MSLQKDPEQNERKLIHRSVNFDEKRVLEIGCGEGRLTWQYAHASSLTIGLDSDRNALRVASIDRPTKLDGKVHFSAAKAEYLPFRKETFDIAILAWSL